MTPPSPGGRSRPPLLATYRLQLHPGFTFADAEERVPYLARLGISHLYLSPVFEAASGSTHGYDVVDPSRLSAALGGRSGFDALVRAAHRHGLGIVLDVVPHHMAIAGRENAWWWEVLALGSRSPHAGHFDIDWNPPEERLRDKVVLPVLGDHYGRVLADGGITLATDDDEVAVVDAGVSVPLAPGTIGGLLERAADKAGDAELALLGRALQALDVPGASGARLLADARAAYARVAERRAADPAVERAVSSVVNETNLDREALHHLLEQQHHRLVRWQVATQELDYRRFFDVNSLVALRTEDGEVFADTHRLALSLVEAGDVDGLRVDHVDGLLDPEGYLRRLRAGAEGAWIVVEKILAADEGLRRTWPCDGTTGYDFAATLTPLLVDPRGEAVLDRAYRELTGDRWSWERHAVTAKREVLQTVLGSDVNRLVNILVRICERRRDQRDLTRPELRAALVEVVAHTNAYRAYGWASPDAPPRLSAHDERYLDEALTAAALAAPRLDPSVFALLRELLTFSGPLGDDEREFALRFQQLTGPATAKGEEDTALYRYVRLLALNDVGHDPSRFGLPVEEFHRWCARIAVDWPRTMLTTSTHDTKRSEDVRARLAVLAEMPERWEQSVWSWHDRTSAYRPDEVDARTEWFVYQTLVGAWPLDADRLWPVLEKSFREAKLRTSWVHPDDAYEGAVRAFVSALLADVDGVAGELGALAGELTVPGRRNSLALVTLRLTAPGVPDTYQGCEGWDLSLVDPDNRRPVDWAAREAMLARAGVTSPADTWRDEPDSGAAKVLWIEKLLQVRRNAPAALGPGATYEPLHVEGPGDPAAVVAFLRGGDVAVVVPRFPLRGGQAHEATTVTLPPGRWEDLATGVDLPGGRATVAALTERFPVLVALRRP